MSNETTTVQRIELYPTQFKFFNDKTPNLGLITGVGFGKGFVGSVKAVTYAMENPNGMGMITAPTFTMMRDSTQRSFFEICRREYIKSFNKNDQELVLNNGFTFLFRSTTHPDHLRGPNTSFLWMDEAGQSPKEAWEILIGRNRKSGFPLQFIVTTTPNGKYHWTYELFGPENLKEGYAVYFGQTKENESLPKEFIDHIYSAYSGQFARQELYGEFVEQSGKVYGGFWDEKVHVGNYEYNPDLPVSLGIDFGFADPTACLVFQQDAVGRVYLIDEIYQRRLPDEDLVAQLRDKEYWHRISNVICDSARPDRIDALRSFGLRKAKKADFEGGGKDNIDLGIQKIIELLKVDPILKTPRFLVDRSCVDTIREFGLYAYPNKSTGRNINQKPVDAHNHGLDSIRYYVVTCITPKKAAFERRVVGPLRRRLMAFDRRK